MQLSNAKTEQQKSQNKKLVRFNSYFSVVFHITWSWSNSEAISSKSVDSRCTFFSNYENSILLIYFLHKKNRVFLFHFTWRCLQWRTLNQMNRHLKLIFIIDNIDSIYVEVEIDYLATAAAESRRKQTHDALESKLCSNPSIWNNSSVWHFIAWMLIFSEPKCWLHISA